MANKDYCELCFEKKDQDNAFYLRITDLNNKEDTGQHIEICKSCKEKINDRVDKNYENS